MMKYTLIVLSLTMAVGCGSIKSYKGMTLSDGTQIRFHSITSHDASAPTITVMALETCLEMQLPTQKAHKSVVSKGDGTFKGGYVRKDTITIEDYKPALECDIQQVGHAYGQSRVRDWLGFGQAAVGAAGFAYGLHSLEPNKYNSNTSNVQSGGGASANSASTSEGGRADSGSSSNSYSETTSSNENTVIDSSYSMISTDSHDTQHITTDDSIHSDDNNIIAQ